MLLLLCFLLLVLFLFIFCLYVDFDVAQRLENWFHLLAVHCSLLLRIFLCVVFTILLFESLYFITLGSQVI